MLKTIASAIFCFIAASEEQPSEATQPKAARGTVAVAPLPAAEYADTEVSTNFPLRVDFTRPLVGAHSGYFSDSTFQAIWYHTRAAGADKWIGVGDQNNMGEYDTARITLELGRIDANGNFTDDPSCGWNDGWITSAVPFGWNTSALRQDDQVDPVKTFDPGANHRFEIDAAGNVSVRKFGNAATRLIDATFKLNGVSCTPIGE